jgi:hypothetical protein
MVCCETIALSRARTVQGAFISSGLYRRARREAINYPLTGAMSRENWCFGRRPAKCGNRVTFVAGQTASTPAGSSRYLAELKTLVCIVV